VASAENANVAKQQFLKTCNVDKNSGYITTHNIKIAGCLPPLAESYRSDLVGPFRNNLLQYRVIVTSLLDYVDLCLCETMSTIAETKSAIEAAVGVMRGNESLLVNIQTFQSVILYHLHTVI
jgi:S-methylmethionine-dependent homocysteine/selenocysteine methylase